MTAVRRARELFVWYRVAPDNADAARVAVDAMQRALEAKCPGLHARLLVRDEGSGPVTWMETYATVDDATAARIASAAASFLPLIDGDRHVEIFELAERP